MQFSTTFIVEDSEPMVHHHLVRLLRAAGYSVLPDGGYQRGTREGSMLSFDPSKWFTRLVADTSSTPEFYTQVVLSYDVQTAGQTLKYQNRKFWLDEVSQFVTGLGGRKDSYQMKLEQALGLDKPAPVEAAAQLDEAQAGASSGRFHDPLQTALRSQRERQMKNGANWFFWVAGLSLVNSILNLFNVDLNFIFGLGATQIVDGIASLMIADISEGLVLIWATALLIDLVILVIFVGFGWLARKQKAWAFILGISLYLCDGIIFLVAGDWFAVLVHGIALFGLIRGYQALRELRKLDEGQLISPA